MIGMIVGAGFFGLPYVAAQAGILPSLFYLLILGAVILVVHWFYGEIVLRTNEAHRLVGYAQKYLGHWGFRTAVLTVFFEYYGALLAYIILGGHFFYLVFGQWLGGSEFWGAAVFFILGAAVIQGGIKTVVRSEFLTCSLLFLMMALLLIKGAPLIKLANWQVGDWQNIFLPYGVILFALGGATAIPEIRPILRGQEKKLRPAITLGTIIPIVIYLIFTLVVVGITGSQTSIEAFNGLALYLGNWVIWLGVILGALVVADSFWIMGLAVQKVYQHDYGIKKIYAFALALAVPFIAYAAGFKNFILVIGGVGVIAGGLDGILIALIYLRARRLGDRRPEYTVRLGRPLAWLIASLFILGIAYQFFYWAK